MIKNNTNENPYNNKNYINVIFSVTVDFNNVGYHMFGKLRPYTEYNFSGEGETLKSHAYPKQKSYEELRRDIVSIINNELESIAIVASNNAVQSVDVLETREGSILVLFQTVINAMQLVSGIKDFYESIELIRKLASTYIKHHLDANYGNYFDVDTTILSYPSKLPLCIDAVPCNKNSTFTGHLQKERDGFFYYLLITNIVLLLLLISLIFKAVMTVYFT